MDLKFCRDMGKCTLFLNATIASVDLDHPYILSIVYTDPDRYGWICNAELLKLFIDELEDICL